MIATIALMLLAAPAADPVAKPRDTHVACLRSQMKSNLAKKTSNADFATEMKTKCATEEAAYRAAILAMDKGDGMTAKAAEDDANELIQDHLDTIGNSYSDYLASGDIPA